MLEDSYSKSSATVGQNRFAAIDQQLQVDASLVYGLSSIVHLCWLSASFG